MDLIYKFGYFMANCFGHYLFFITLIESHYYTFCNLCVPSVMATQIVKMRQLEGILWYFWHLTVTMVTVYNNISLEEEEIEKDKKLCVAVVTGRLTK